MPARCATHAWTAASRATDNPRIPKRTAAEQDFERQARAVLKKGIAGCRGCAAPCSEGCRTAWFSTPMLCRCWSCRAPRTATGTGSRRASWLGQIGRPRRHKHDRPCRAPPETGGHRTGTALSERPRGPVYRFTIRHAPCSRLAPVIASTGVAVVDAHTHQLAPQPIRRCGGVEHGTAPVMRAVVAGEHGSRVAHLGRGWNRDHGAGRFGRETAAHPAAKNPLESGPRRCSAHEQRCSPVGRQRVERAGTGRPSWTAWLTCTPSTAGSPSVWGVCQGDGHRVRTRQRACAAPARRAAAGPRPERP
jgi:hypothetical protein